MNESKTFIRGQVWFWEDPIYGSKENKQQVAIGEVTMRYNRYCIIVQSTNVIDKSSVVVVPCSSSPNTDFDVPIQLSYLFEDGYSYARVKNLFPVHPKYLTRYICTLPDDKMKEIEAEIAKMLVPSIVDILGKDGFKEIFGSDYDSNYHKPIRESANILEMHVRLFIKEHLVKSDNDEDVISAHDLKDAYDQFCVVHNFNIDTDIVEFLDMFTKLTSNNSYNFMMRSRFNIVNFKGIRLRGNIELTIDLNDQDMINPDDPQKSVKWTDELIISFLNEYNENGVESASEKFGLKASTATSYWYKWKDKLEEQTAVEEEIKEEEQYEVIHTISKIPSTRDIVRSVSKISNFIRNECKDNGLYYNGELKVRDGRESRLVYLVDAIDEKTFYSKLDIAIYYSFIDFLSVKIRQGDVYVPKLYENSRYLDTWHFFDKAFHDQRVSRNCNISNTIAAYRKCFPDRKGIEKEWIEILKRSIASKISLSPESIDDICNEVSKLCLESK